MVGALVGKFLGNKHLVNGSLIFVFNFTLLLAFVLEFGSMIKLKQALLIKEIFLAKTYLFSFEYNMF